MATALVAQVLVRRLVVPHEIEVERDEGSHGERDDCRPRHGDARDDRAPKIHVRAARMHRAAPHQVAGGARAYVKRTCQRPDQEQDKCAVVACADASSEPRAVVVEDTNAVVAVAAVLGARRAQDLTCLAPVHAVLGLAR